MLIGVFPLFQILEYWFKDKMNRRQCETHISPQCSRRRMFRFLRLGLYIQDIIRIREHALSQSTHISTFLQVMCFSLPV